MINGDVDRSAFYEDVPTALPQGIVQAAVLEKSQ
jgi:hypothetical protein